MKKIERVILFGDSFIQGTGCFHKLETDGRMIYHHYNENRNPELIKFQNYEAYTKNILKYFPNIEVINFARDGFSNYESFDELNKFFKNDYRKTDLILFGFTSKFRDFSKSSRFVWNTYPNLLSDDNPLIDNPLAWDKNDYYLNQNYWGKNGYGEYDESENEKELSHKFVLDYTNYLHDDYFLDYISKANYIFIQNWVESHDINFHCFDLFENYVVGNIGNFKINDDIYINYNNHRNNSMLEYLKEEESKNPLNRYQNFQIKVSYFEHNNSFENYDTIRNTELIHPNQFGYKKWVDYLFQNILVKKYY